LNKRFYFCSIYDLMSIIIQAIFFILLIIFIHYIWNLLKDKFTIKKTKDMNSTIEKYKSLVENTINLNPPPQINTSLEEIEDDLNRFLEQTLSTSI